jgi:PadR family transcriptional regulator, regulatory protein PadR
MAKGDFLSDLEQLILAAVMILGENAYGMTVHEKVEELAEGFREVSLGSAYMALERLERKGYVKSWVGEATAERGGKAKKYFKVTGTGQMVVKNSLLVSRNVSRQLGVLAEIGGVA